MEQLHLYYNSTKFSCDNVTKQSFPKLCRLIFYKNRINMTYGVRLTLKLNCNICALTLITLE